MEIETPVPIHVAMSRVMADMKAIDKKNRNTQQNYAFRGIDDVFNELQPVLVEHGVWYTPIDVETDYEWRQTKAGGWQHSATIKVTYRFTGPAGDFVDAKVPGESADPADKCTGQAMSQALKTLLLQTFCIRTQESARSDPDSKSPEAGEPAPKTVDLMPYVKEKMNGEQWALLKEQWMKDHPFSVFGVPVEREQEFRKLIDNHASETKPAEAGAVAETTEPQVMNQREARKSLLDLLVESIGDEVVAKPIRDEIWNASGYGDLSDLGPEEIAVLETMAQRRIDEFMKPTETTTVPT